MTEEEFDVLRRWGEALVDDQRAEVRAAGRAILMLSTEVERLQVELWHSRLGVGPVSSTEPDQPEPAPASESPRIDPGEEMPSTLGRLIGAARLRGRAPARPSEHA